MKSTLITGITGQDGAYMSKLLLEKDYKVFGLVPRRSTDDQYWRLKWLGVDLEKITFLPGDVTDFSSTLNAITKSDPCEIYNFAAQSFAPASWSQPELTFETNIVGLLNLLNAILDRGIKLYQASTSEMIGGPLDSDSVALTKFNPKNPYAVAKLAAHHLCQEYREKYEMFIVSGVCFNHESPLRGKEFVTRKITDGVARIVAGLEKKLVLGELYVKRDWGFAGDYVEGVWRMLQREEPKDYFIGTGIGTSVKDWVKQSFAFAHLKDWDKYIEIDRSLIRKADTKDLIGTCKEIKEELGWKPEMGVLTLNLKMIEADFTRYGLSQRKGEAMTDLTVSISCSWRGHQAYPWKDLEADYSLLVPFAHHDQEKGN